MIAFYAKAEVQKDSATNETIVAGKSMLSLETNTNAMLCLKTIS